MIELNRDVEILQQRITIPSEIHGYSLAVEYVKQWFTNKFNQYFMPIDRNGHRDDFFKTIYINGKHVFDDFRQFNQNKEKILKREKPIVIFTPTINIDNDRRNGLKSLQNLTGPEMFYNTSIDYGKYFFYDTKNNIKVILSMDTLEVAFNIKVKVDTLAKQVDIYRFMNLYFRVGDTQSEFVDMDFNFPSHIIYQIAMQSNHLDKDGKIKDPMQFLRYLNMHSKLPITYKLRTINGNPEYFIRVPQLYVHINNTDKLDRDDGERRGMLNNDYTIDMNIILTIPIPFMYCYITNRETPVYIPTVETADLGLYNVKIYDIPERNNRGWETYFSSQITLDCAYLESGKSEKANFKALLDQVVVDICETCKSQYLAPGIFLDVQAYNIDNKISVEVDWETYDVIFYGPTNPYNNVIDLVIYIDQEFVNDYLMKNNKGRLPDFDKNIEDNL